jgi:hypothetical protein
LLIGAELDAMGGIHGESGLAVFREKNDSNMKTIKPHSLLLQSGP